ncbi:MAG TPA: BLUF domain-containing protein [Planctomycetota bacterium]|nr:BLUF domain-containing protein [Planctomycetota bacterium]
MYDLAYASSAVGTFTPAQLVELLQISRDNNERLGITGMLLYKDGNFMQVLEGEESSVKALYAKIALDPRHRGVLQLLQSHETERQFPDWSMGFRDLSGAAAHDIPGYSEFLNEPLTAPAFASVPGRCRKLLALFRQSMR